MSDNFFSQPRAKFRAPASLSSGSGYSVRKRALTRSLLGVIAVLGIWRSTGMWFGYPGSYDDFKEVDTIGLRVILYALIPLILIYLSMNLDHAARSLTRIPILIAITFFFCIVSVLFSVDFAASVRGAIATLLVTTAPLLYRLHFGTRRTFQLLTTFFIIAGIINILYTIFFPRFALMSGFYDGAVKGLFLHKNGLGQFCAIGIIILTPFARHDLMFRWDTIIKFVGIGVLLTLLYLSQSSTAVVMLVGGILITIVAKSLRKVPSPLVRSLLISFSFALLIFFSASLVLGFAETISSTFGKDLTFSGRTVIWEQLLPLVYDRPLVGYGLAAFRQISVMETYVQANFVVRSVHNSYLGLALEIGAIGAAAWIVFLLKSLFIKSIFFPRSADLSELQAKQIAITVLVMIGSTMEANMMIAPDVLWPFLVIALPRTERERKARRQLDCRLDTELPRRLALR